MHVNIVNRAAVAKPKRFDTALRRRHNPRPFIMPNESLTVM